MKKKILMSITIILVMILTMLGKVQAANYALGVSSKIENKTVTVTMKITNAGEGIDALQGKISFDTNQVELLEVKQANSNWKEPSYASSTGIFTALVKGESVKEVSDALTFTFQVKDGVTGKIDIHFSDLALASSKDEKIMVGSTSTSVTIENKEPDDSKNEVNNNTTTNNVVDNTIVENTTNNTTVNNITNTANTQNEVKTTNNTIKGNSTQNTTQAQTKLPKTGVQIGILYFIGVVAVIAGISILRYRNLSK